MDGWINELMNERQSTDMVNMMLVYRHVLFAELHQRQTHQVSPTDRPA